MVDSSTTCRPRRRWSVARKAAIPAELREPGATLSTVARRHGLSPGLLYRWRSSSPVERQPAVPRFAEVIASIAVPSDAAIENETPGQRLRVPVATRAETLVAILRVLSGSR